MRTLILLALASAAMAYTPVQVGPGATNTCSFAPGSPGSGNLTCSFPGNVTTGNVLVISIGVRVQTASAVSSISDTVSSNFTGGLKSTAFSATDVAMWTYVVTAGGTGAYTVTVTINGTYFFGWIGLLEYDATQLTATTEGTDGKIGIGTPNNCTATTFTPSVSNALVVASDYNNNSNATNLVKPTNYTQRTYSGASSARRQFMMADRSETTPITETPAFTGPGATDYACTLVALAPVVPPRHRQAFENWNYKGNPNPDWSIAFIGDQHPDASAGGSSWATTATYLLNKQSAWNTQAYLFSGDIQGNAGSANTTPQAFSLQGWASIVAAGKPTIAAEGNHDCDGDLNDCLDRLSAQMDLYVGYTPVQGASWGPVRAFSQVGDDLGWWTDPTHGSKANFAIKIPVNGHKILVIALEFSPRPDTGPGPLAWARALAAHYSDYVIIWLTHMYQTHRQSGTMGHACTASDTFCAGSAGFESFATTGLNLWDATFKLQANSAFVLSGHFYSGTGTLDDSWSYLTTAGTNGNVIHQWMQDFQGSLPAGNHYATQFLFHEQTRTFDIFVWDTVADTLFVSRMGIAWPAGM